MNWYRETIPVLEETLHTSQTVGLTEAAAAEQLQAVGPNRLKEKPKKTFLQRFVEQLKDFMVIILIIAAVISMISTILEGTNDWLEPIIIIGIVLVNAFLGVIQESKAEAALEALQSMASPTAKVVRNGQQISIPSENVVPGDLLILEAGDFIPADARLIESASLRCEESALTGESVPSEKDASVTPAENAGIGDRVNMVYSGCSVSYGRGKALVTATGMQTEMGKIATMLESTEAMTTPLQLKLAQLGKTLGILALAICGIIFLIGFATGGELLEMFMTAVSLAVAAIPEGLPAIVTIVLAMGVQRMVKKNAIIKSLPAVETLGSASVICSDKTGTLTLNRMTMMEVYCNAKKTVFADEAPDEDTKKFLTLSALCCDGNVEIRDGEEIHIGDPTETGIVAAALQHTGHTKAELDQRFPRVAEIPFDSDRKLMTTVNMLEGKPYAIVKGAPDLLLERCISVDQDSVLKANREMAENALRVLAVAIKPLESVPDAPTSDTLENGLTFLGLLGMIDPPRPEAAVAVRTCHEAGIRTVMITGDHVITASAIAKDLGIMEEGQKAVSGQELKQMSEADLENEVENISVYARVSPEDKIRIVQAWQKKDHVVAMTGDGV
ncbi:MAG TPA: HAD-IC family P-type ATPase, partial [Firmicutes bacterium]|nr:HAD-IC family P-type ATPase [Bacillota bacterium]